MKESNIEDNIINNAKDKNIINPLNENTYSNLKIKENDQKNSIENINGDEIKNKEFKPDEQSATLMTQIQFLDNKRNQGALFELNKSLEKTDDTSKNSSNIKEDQKEPNQQKETFFQKTKRWAGTAWSYINIANYFPKEEFKEYRNANGDWVKIPVKKTPLKKKKIEETDEEYMINKMVQRDRGNIANFTGDRIPIPNLF